MNFSTLLDVGIGLVIIYFIAALLVSGIQEIIASIFQWRSKHLKKAIFQMMLNNLSSEDSSTPQEDSFKFAEGFRGEIYKNSGVAESWDESIFESLAPIGFHRSVHPSFQ